MKKRSKSEPTSRMLDAQANEIIKQLVEAAKNGSNYITALMDGECDLFELFDRKFNPKVVRRVFERLPSEEEILASKP